MQVGELDVVKLKDGREGTVLEVFANPLGFWIEIGDEMELWPIVTLDEIEEVTYRSK